MKNKSKDFLFISIVLFWFAQYVYIPFQTPHLVSLKISSSFIGVIIGVYGMSQMLLRLPIGLLADVENRHKTIIIVGALSSGIASIFRIVLNNGTGFFIANILSGLASAMWISFMILYMSYYPGEHQKATGKLVFGCNLGILLGFITSTCLYSVIGMKMICLLSVIGGLVSTIFALQIDKGEPYQSKTSIRELLKVCKRKNLIFFSLLAIIQQGIQMTTTMSYTTQIIKSLGASSLIVGCSSIIYMISSVCFSKFASSDLCINIGPKKLIPCTLVLLGLYCALIPNCSEVYQICILQVVPGVASGVLFTCLTSEAIKGLPENCKSTAMGFHQAVYALGMTMFPIICGSIANASSMKHAFYFLTGTCIIGLLLTIFFYKHNEIVN